MSTSRQAVLLRGLLPLALIPAVFLCAILATVILEVFVDRRGLSSSLTTLFPGVAYATALVMKVCIAEGLVSAVVFC